jgi:hypothetical protein
MYSPKLVSCPRNTFHNFSRFYDTLVGVWGSLFSFTTIYPEVVERHHIFAYYEAAPRTMYPQRRTLLVPVHRTPSSLGAVTGLGVFWVVEMKRDPHAPFESVQQVLIIQVNSETRHSNMGKRRILAFLCAFGTKPIPTHQMCRPRNGRPVKQDRFLVQKFSNRVVHKCRACD